MKKPQSLSCYFNEMDRPNHFPTNERQMTDILYSMSTQYSTHTQTLPNTATGLLCDFNPCVCEWFFLNDTKLVLRHCFRFS
ncbi:TPA_asm: hypothetical protein [Branchiostoma lancelet adintovirus]|uniref:Uncharacterized protein n=1 Tax=Branchiostoma lancelet adintovirus TaxID=2597807 RepID=A0A5H3CT17_9VIRU|nr:TPA_asm: hypothetical protein [Branchiostoma lancelet adintovirus]